MTNQTRSAKDGELWNDQPNKVSHGWGAMERPTKQGQPRMGSYGMTNQTRSAKDGELWNDQPNKVSHGWGAME